MSASHLQEIKKLLIGLAEYFRTTLTPMQLSMYAEDLEDLPLEAIGQAMRQIRRNASERFMPMPSQIRELVSGNARDEALEASNRILEAMAKYGYVNPDRAKLFIGELGWRVVEREGGWEALCQRTSSDDLPILKAQWRELAAATLRRGASGIDSRAPSLTRSDNKQQLTSIAAMLPTIAKGKP